MHVLFVKEAEDMAKSKYDDQPLWQDRKRILGMPISFTKYQFDTERLTISRGLLTTTVDEVLLYRILDIKMTRTLGQKFFGVGTIHVYSADKTEAHLDLVNIKNADEVRRRLSRLVEKIREEKRMVGREMFGTAGYDAMTGGDAFAHDIGDMDGMNDMH